MNPAVVLFSVLLFAVLLGAFFATRWEIARRAGVVSKRAIVGAPDPAWTGVSRARKVVFMVAGPLVWWLCSVLFLTTSLLVTGEAVPQPGLHLVIAHGTPAEAGGLHDGDEVIWVDDVVVDDWSSLRATLSRHPGEPVPIYVHRGSENVLLHVTPDATGMIGVGPVYIRKPASLAYAAGQAFPYFFRVMLHEGQGTAVGAIAVAPQIQASLAGLPGGLAAALYLVGVLAAYFFLLPFFLSFALFPRPGIGARH